MAAISYRTVSKRYTGSGQAAVHDISLEVPESKFVVLLGPSGCGKTTLLKMTNRLIEPSSGTIEVNGRNTDSVSVTELRRHMGYVIQQVGLFPHQTVATNIATVPRLLHWPRKRIEQRIDELLDLVHLAPAEFRKRYPSQLSGGQQQRVGLARALASDPAILLMDEPFGAIDAITRLRLQDQLLAIQRRVKKTVLFVTHDVDEALRLADMIVVMRDGVVLQYDSPLNILAHPADDFVRRLLNTDDVFREFGLMTVRASMSPGSPAVDGPTIAPDENLREALSLMIAGGVERLTVVEDGAPVGTLTMSQIQRLGARDSRRPVPVSG
ncbi:MAG TPA: ABC transporter ATP-binding protein [Chloroflexota bacterium]|nr:ABC transporter ATP-binding protein [Chloroflexota bacterium]